MPSNIFKLIDYDAETAHFESFNSRIHIMTLSDERPDGVTVSIDLPAARRLATWLIDVVGPNQYYGTPTIIKEED